MSIRRPVYPLPAVTARIVVVPLGGPVNNAVPAWMLPVGANGVYGLLGAMVIPRATRLLKRASCSGNVPLSSEPAGAPTETLRGSGMVPPVIDANAALWVL